MSALVAAETSTSFRSKAVIGSLTIVTACLTALAAQWYIPLWPVPVTAQTLVVLMGAIVLGVRPGVTAQVMYLVAGALGLPIFSGGQGGISVLFGAAATTSGYLLAFPLASGVVGRLSASRELGPMSMVGLLIAGNIIIYAGGVLGLMLVLGVNAIEALQVGVIPFLVGDAIKIALGAALWRGYRAIRSSRAQG